jgi:hypothetical protein
MPDCPEGLWVGVVFHVAEILEAFLIETVAIYEVFFVDFQCDSEDAEEWEENFVVDVLFSSSQTRACA